MLSQLIVEDVVEILTITYAVKLLTVKYIGREEKTELTKQDIALFSSDLKQVQKICNIYFEV